MKLEELETEWKCLQAAYPVLATWTFGYYNRKRSFGTCWFHLKRIKLSRWHAENDSTKHVVDTLRHEAAHALADTEAGKRVGHGSEWKRWCRLLGATPERLVNRETMKQLAKPPAMWMGVCPGCGKEFHYYRKPKHLTGSFCLICGPIKGQLVISRVKKPQTPKQPSMFD